MKNTVTTFTGREVSLLAPEPSTIAIMDIAHGLAHQCRYAGQSPHFYSVAEHCVHIANAIDKEYALAGLMHDAAEAYLGDVTKPLKQLLPEYKVIEERMEQVICEKFNIEYPFPDAVHEWDKTALQKEMSVFWGNGPRYAGVIPVEAWDPWTAKVRFLELFKTLTDG